MPILSVQQYLFNAKFLENLFVIRTGHAAGGVRAGAKAVEAERRYQMPPTNCPYKTADGDYIMTSMSKYDEQWPKFCR